MSMMLTRRKFLAARIGVNASATADATVRSQLANSVPNPRPKNHENNAA